MLQCNLAGCGEVVVMAGETQIDQVVNDDGNGWAYEQMLKPRTVFPCLHIIKLDEDTDDNATHPPAHPGGIFFA